MTVATILLDNASYLSVHLPWLQSDKMAARTVDGVPRHLHKEEVTSEMCKQHSDNMWHLQIEVTPG